MHKLILICCISIQGIFSLSAQKFVQVSVGKGYSKQAYYNLSTDSIVQLPNESWELAFTTIGARDIGVLINESTTSITGAPAPELILYSTTATSFSEKLDISMLVKRIYNDESSWEGGAFNLVADPANRLDFGWGVYNVTNNTLTGNRVFVVQLRDGSLKKLIVESYAEGAYNIKYANLDGSNEKSASIKKSDFNNTPLAFFSFATGTTLPALAPWDLYFGRYYTQLDDNGSILDYPVTGTLTGPGIEVAKAIKIDPAKVTFDAYKDSLQSRLDVIGHEWKIFSFTDGWIMSTDRAYFVKLPDGRVFKLVFIDFEGSTTGVSTFEKTELGVVSSVANPQSIFTEAMLYPNPVQNEANLMFSLKERQALQIALQDMLGRIIWRADIVAERGFNSLTIPTMNLPKGSYLLSLSGKKDIFSIKVLAN